MSKSKNQITPPDPQKVYKLALRYSEASRILKSQEKEEGWGASAPRLLVDSFAIELYLKCLYVLDTGSRPPMEHNWVKLFDALDLHTKSIIREKFDRIVNDNPILRNLDVVNPDAKKVTDFSRSLNAAGSTFDKRRYLYEAPPDGEWFYAHILHEAIRTVTSMDLRLAGVCLDDESSKVDLLPPTNS